MITENFGEFDRSFNIGKLPGGFGGAAATSAAVASTAATASLSTLTTPDTPLSAMKSRRTRPASFSPTSPVVEKTQSLAAEFLTLSTSRIDLMNLIKTEEDEDEKATLEMMLGSVVKRRKEIAELSAK